MLNKASVRVKALVLQRLSGCKNQVRMAYRVSMQMIFFFFFFSFIYFDLYDQGIYNND